MSKIAHMNVRACVALNLRRLRLEKGWSQTVLSERVGMDRTYVSSLERGANGATIDMLAKLGQALGVEPAAFLQRTKPLRRRR